MDYRDSDLIAEMHAETADLPLPTPEEYAAVLRMLAEEDGRQAEIDAAEDVPLDWPSDDELLAPIRKKEEG